MHAIFSEDKRVDPSTAQTRFQAIQNIRESLLPKMSFQRDVLLRRNVICISYYHLSKNDLYDLKTELTQVYHPRYCLQFLSFLEIKSRGLYQLNLYFNKCKTISEHFYDPVSRQITAPSLKEVAYIFARTTQILNYYSSSMATGLPEYYGNVNECGLYVDQDNKIRVFFYPSMHNQDAFKQAVVDLNSGASLKHKGYIFSPELLETLRSTSILKLDNRNLVESDKFCLALLCIRLLSPQAYYQSVDIQRMKVDLFRLNMLLQTVGIFVNNHFSQILRQCIEFNPGFRPSYEILLDELKVYGRWQIAKQLSKGYPRPEKEAVLLENDEFYVYTSNEGNPNLDSMVSPLTRKERSREEVIRNAFLMNQMTPVSYQRAPQGRNDQQSELNHAKQKCIICMDKDVYQSLKGRETVQDRLAGSLRTKKSSGKRAELEVGYLRGKNGNFLFGYFLEGVLHTKGVNLYSTGDVYYGSYCEGSPHGRGVLFSKDGSQVTVGDWTSGRLNGPAILATPHNGYLYHCEYEWDLCEARRRIDPSQDGGISDSLEGVNLLNFYLSLLPQSDLIASILGGHSANKGNQEANMSGWDSKISNLPLGSEDRFKYIDPQDTMSPIIQVPGSSAGSMGDTNLGRLNFGGHSLLNRTIPEDNGDSIGQDYYQKPGVLDTEPSYNKIYALNKRQELSGILKGDKGTTPETRIPDSTIPRGQFTTQEIPRNKRGVDVSDFNIQGHGSPMRTLISKYKDDKYFVQDDEEMNKMKKAYVRHRTMDSQEVDPYNLSNISELVHVHEGNTNASDQLTGPSLVHFEEGSRFEGLFKNGLPHGPGVFYPLRGQPIRGDWEAGILKKRAASPSTLKGDFQVDMSLFSQEVPKTVLYDPKLNNQLPQPAIINTREANMSTMKSEANDAFNQRVIQAEEEKWEREQIHMECQILNEINNGIKIQDLLQKSEKREQHIRTMREKKRKSIERKKLRMEEQRKRNYEQAIEVRKNKNRKLRKQLMKSENRFEKNKSRVEQQRSQLSKSKFDKDEVPMHQLMLEKSHKYQQRKQENERMTLKQVKLGLRKLQGENEKTDYLLEQIRQEQQRKHYTALSKAEENREKANQNHEQKIHEITESYRKNVYNTLVWKEKKRLAEEKRKQVNEARRKNMLNRMEDFRDNKESNKRERLRKMGKKKRKALNEMEKRKIQKMEELEKRQEENLRHAQEVRERHEQNLYERKLYGEELMDDIQHKYQRVQAQRAFKKQMIENTKLMLGELEVKKEGFKETFAQFNANNENAQKDAIQKLEQNGIKFQKLQDRLNQLREEEERKQREAEEKRKKELEERDMQLNQVWEGD